MKNLKKYLAVIIAVIMVATTILPAIAADTTTSFKYATEAKKLYDLGLVKGESETEYVPALEKSLDRQTGVVMILRIFGEESDALALKDSEVTTLLEKFDDQGSISDWAKKQVAYAVSKGYVVGMNDATTGKLLFGPAISFEGKAYATIVMRKLGYSEKEQDFSYETATMDISTVGGLTDEQAEEFATKKLTRDDLAGMTFGALKAVYKADNKTIVEKLIENGKIKAEDLQKVDATLLPSGITLEAQNGELKVKFITAPSATPAVTDFVVTRSVDGAAATTVTARFKSYDATTKTAVLSVDMVVGGEKEKAVVYGVKYKDMAAVNSPAFKVAVVTDLKIESVTATNLRQAFVKFNQPVDETTAERVGNYDAIDGKSISTAVLGSDGVTVTLNLEQELTNSSTNEISLTARDVKSKDLAATLAETTVKFKAYDQTIPSVKSVTVLGNKGLRIEFSEPVNSVAAKSPSNYTFVNETIDIKSVELDDTTGDKTSTLATVNLTSVLTSGEHKFRINSTGLIKDYNLVAVPSQDFVINVALDTSLPTVTDVKVNSRTEVEAIFSKPVNIANASDVKWNTSGSKDSGTSASSFTKVSDTDYKFTFASAISVGKAYIAVLNDNILDYSSNKMSDDFVKEVTVAAEAAPNVSSVSVKDDKTFYVYFDKDVKSDTTSSSATYKSNYTFKTSAGVALTSSDSASIDSSGHPTVTIEYSTDDKKATISLGSNSLSGAAYKLTVSGIQDKISQTMTSQTFDITVTDNTQPTVSSATYNGKTVIVNFSEAMDASSLTTASNYKYYKAASSITKVDLPSATLTAFNNNKSLKIVFSSYTPVNNDKLIIGEITNTGVINAPRDASVNKNFIQKDLVIGIAAGIVSSSAAIKFSEGTLSIETPTQLKFVAAGAAPQFDGSTLNVNDFNLATTSSYNASSLPTGSFVPTKVELDTSDDENKTVLITVSDDDKFDSSSIIYILAPHSADNINTKDIYGNKIASNNVTAEPTNNIGPVLKAASIIDSESMLIAFDSKIALTDIVNLSNNLKISKSNEIYAGIYSPLNENKSDNNIVFTLSSGLTFDTEAKYKVTTKGVDYITVKGVNGAKIAANTTGIDTVSFAATSLTYNTGYIVKFNANLDFKTIKDIDWAANAGENNNFAGTYSADDKTVDIANIGTFSGLSAGTSGNFKVTKVDDTSFKIVIINDGGTVTGAAASLISFKPASNIKTSSGVVVSDLISPTFLVQ